MIAAVSSLNRNPGPLSQIRDYIQQQSPPRGGTEDEYKQKAEQGRLLQSSAENRIQTQLQSISSAVKAHEKTHLAVLGPAAAGPIQYSYVVGPGGERYAVGGSIKVDLKPVPGNPEETIRKARRIRMASYAVNSPSGADMRVAAEAYRIEIQAKRELAEERAEQEGKAVNVLV
jgi:hypothetical protein